MDKTARLNKYQKGIISILLVVIGVILSYLFYNLVIGNYESDMKTDIYFEVENRT